MLRSPTALGTLELLQSLDAKLETAKKRTTKSLKVEQKLQAECDELQHQLLATIVPLAENNNGFKETDLHPTTIAWLKGIGGYGTTNQLWSPLFTPAVVKLSNPPAETAADILRFMRSEHPQFGKHPAWQNIEPNS